MIRVVREKNAYIHFVDERDFKEVSSVGIGKSKKNRAVGFVLTVVSAESTSEDDEVESDCSSTSENWSSSAQPDENVYKTWTPGPWTTPLDPVHGPPLWTRSMDHPYGPNTGLLKESVHKMRSSVLIYVQNCKMALNCAACYWAFNWIYFGLLLFLWFLFSVRTSKTLKTRFKL